MPEPDLIELFVQPLNQTGIRYLISGSVAAMLYGEPRVTHDIDFVVFLRSEDADRLAAIFAPPQFSFRLPPLSWKKWRGKEVVILTSSMLTPD